MGFLWITWGDSPQPSRHAGVTASAAAAGVNRSLESAFKEADVLQLSAEFAPLYALETRRKEDNKKQMNCGMREGKRSNKYRCDIMPQQRGFIDPKLYTKYELKRRQTVTVVILEQDPGDGRRPSPGGEKSLLAIQIKAK